MSISRALQISRYDFHLRDKGIIGVGDSLVVVSILVNFSGHANYSMKPQLSTVEI